MMRDIRDRNDKWIGFIDPYVVYKDTVIPDPNNQRLAEMERTSSGSCITKGTDDQYCSPITWGKVLLSCAYFILLSQSSIKIYILTDL
jgi:hypothetical protein